MTGLEPIVIALLAAIGGGGASSFLRARSQNGKDEAEAESIEVRTARELIAEVRFEMNRRVSDLDREIGRLRGHLESTRQERDKLLETERSLREENAQLRTRIESLEARILELASELASRSIRRDVLEAAEAAAPIVKVAVEPPAVPVPGGRRSTDPV